MPTGFWTTSTSRMRRMTTIVAFLLLSLFVTSIGALTPLSREDASSIDNELEQVRQNVSVQNVFGNNLMICMVMFVPIVGPAFGLWALYNTGVVIAAEGIVQGVPSLLLLYSLFIFPFAWLEFISYSTALAESVWLIQRARQKMMRKEVKNAAVLVAIVATMLLVAAAIETALIAYLGGP